MIWPLWVGLVLCSLVVVAVGLSAFGSTCWTDTSRVLTRRLEATRIDHRAQSPSPQRYDSRELEGLPAAKRRGKAVLANIAAHKLKLAELSENLEGYRVV